MTTCDLTRLVLLPLDYLPTFAWKCASTSFCSASVAHDTSRPPMAWHWALAEAAGAPHVLYTYVIFVVGEV